MFVYLADSERLHVNLLKYKLWLELKAWEKRANARL